MATILSQRDTQKFRSISTRFSYLLISVVSVLMIIFAVSASYLNLQRINSELETKLSSYLSLSSVSLEAPLWNLDHSITEGYIDSLLLDEAVVFAKVTATDGTIVQKRQNNGAIKEFDDFAGSTDYITGRKEIIKDEETVGRLELAVSRATVRQEIILNILGVAALTLFLIVAIALISLRISRHYIAHPLATLQKSAAAIAQGDLDADIPAQQNDEIGGLAQEFDGMRSSIRNLIGELQEANATLEQRVSERTREVVNARQRLIDAIESISEGFAFYDADDRLVLKNSRYQDLLYSGTEIVIEPGMTFEEILRVVAAEGKFEFEGDDVEHYLSQRLNEHRNPDKPILQQRSDGRWIQISERKTGDDGIVAVFSDLTELKQREQELASKSNTLEQLSNQLAKYLSPQIYDSIFTGKQEVKLTSSRKKLTVFFSDIEGFTETADRLESEDLTQVLNQYLTEMSRIALNHGATIDKYVGDAIMIFFGDPQSRGAQQDALACVQMAIAMRARMLELEKIWMDAGIGMPLKCRMGIHTGYCTVGNFGSEDRMDYTIIGGAVNTASRLESSAESGEILISYETFAMVKDQIQCEKVGQIEVRGIAYPVDTYKVLDHMNDVVSTDHEFTRTLAALKKDSSQITLPVKQREQAITLLNDLLAYVSDSDPSTE